MNRPKVLVFIDWFLPGYKAGGPVTSLKHMIEYLHEEIDFYVVTRNTDYQSTEVYDLPVNKWVPGKYCQTYYISEEALTKGSLEVVVTSQNFDFFYVNGIYSKYFSILPLQLLKSKSNPVIVAPRGMLAPSAMAIKPVKKKLFLFLARLRGLYSKVTFHATNEQEKRYIQNTLKQDSVKIAPNLGPQFSPRESFPKQPGELKLIFLGRIAPEKNTLLAIESLQGLEEGQVHLDIVGETYDQDYLKLCKKASEALPGNVHVNFLGSVSPEQVSKKLQGHHYMFLPTRGENFGHAILESFMSGVPVIISDQTPWTDSEKEGIAFVNTNNEKEIRDCIKNLVVQNQSDYDDICTKTETFAHNYVQKSDILDQTRALFNLI